MSHLDKVVCIQEEREPIIAIPFQPKKQSTFFTSCLLVANTVILTLILLISCHAYHKMNHFMHKYEKVVNIFVTPDPDPEVVGNVNNFIRDTASSFFFGSTNGSIPVFLRDSVFTFDYPSFGAQVAKFAQETYAVMSTAVPPSSCKQILTCTTQGWLTCANGKSRYCNAAGDQVNCADDSCIAPDVASVASIVEGVATLIGKVSPAGTNAGADKTPAFSNGLLRVDQVLNWVKRQANGTEWKVAAKACQAFSFNVKNIDWSGSYFNANGEQKSWEANKEVKQAAGYVDQICDPLATLVTSSKKSHTTPSNNNNGPRHHSNNNNHHNNIPAHHAAVVKKEEAEEIFKSHN